MNFSHASACVTMWGAHLPGLIQKGGFVSLTLQFSFISSGQINYSAITSLSGPQINPIPVLCFISPAPHINSAHPRASIMAQYLHTYLTNFDALCLPLLAFFPHISWLAIEEVPFSYPEPKCHIEGEGKREKEPALLFSRWERRRGNRDNSRLFLLSSPCIFSHKNGFGVLWGRKQKPRLTDPMLGGWASGQTASQKGFLPSQG